MQSWTPLQKHPHFVASLQSATELALPRSGLVAGLLELDTVRYRVQTCQRGAHPNHLRPKEEEKEKARCEENNRRRKKERDGGEEEQEEKRGHGAGVVRPTSSSMTCRPCRSRRDSKSCVQVAHNHAWFLINFHFFNCSSSWLRVYSVWVWCGRLPPPPEPWHLR